VIDWQRVSELRDEVGTEDFEEVVELFLEEVDGVVDRLGCLANRATLRDDLHFLKGSAMNLGFSELAVCCAEGERCAAAGNSEAIDLAFIVKTYETSKAAFLAGRSASAA